MITKWSHPSEFQSSIMVSRQLGTRRMSPGQYEAGEEETPAGGLSPGRPEGAGQPVHGQGQPDGDDRRAELTIRPPSWC